MRNLQEQVKKELCYQKLFWPFDVWINCSSNLKNFANSRPSVSNFKSFSQSLEHFFLTIDQNNFGNKITIIYLGQVHEKWVIGSVPVTHSFHLDHFFVFNVEDYITMFFAFFNLIKLVFAFLSHGHTRCLLFFVCWFFVVGFWEGLGRKDFVNNLLD